MSGTLYYVPASECARLRSLPWPETARAAVWATAARINALYMIARAGSGHIGSSFSSLDVLSWLHLEVLQEGDQCFSSKGHDAPALYATWIGLGWLEESSLHTLRRLGGLPGHPDVSTPHVVTNTGSLGMGISKAKGLLEAWRLQGRTGRVYVLTGDGELQEGQIWESLLSAVNRRLHQLTVIVDHNKLQSDTLVSRVSDLGDVEAKFAAFGWHVARCDGHDLAAVASAVAAAQTVTDRPQVIIADTIKGRGVSFMEHTACDSDVELYRFHSGAPSEEAYTRGVQELIDHANGLLTAQGAAPLSLETVTRPATSSAGDVERLIPAYTEALLAQARRRADIVALDADLMLDTGLIAFQREFPDRFLECGIAEQDMVSQAGGLALAGALPIVHSFACFLSARPNEQIYNNATERTKIIYVGSLAGVVPGGPGHSHQAVRDLSALGAMPGLVIVEPSCAAEVGPLLSWAITTHRGSAYLRLVSVPCVVPYALPEGYAPVEGRGVTLARHGVVAAQGSARTVIVAYGPALLAQAVYAADRLQADGWGRVDVINMPFLNRIDVAWWRDACRDVADVAVLDNHFADGGLGMRMAAALAPWGVPVRRRAIDDIPVCGTPDEVLSAHGLDAAAIAGWIAG